MPALLSGHGHGHRPAAVRPHRSPHDPNSSPDISEPLEQQPLLSGGDNYPLPAEQQPLLPGAGNYPPPLRKPRGSLLKGDDLNLIIVLPWVTFTATAIAVGMIPQSARFLTYAIAALGCLNATIFMVLGYNQSQQKDRSGAAGSACVGLLCMAALATGWTVGLLADYSYMDEYWRLAHGASHSNVAASGLGAAAYSDSSKVEFETGTFIDTERTLGYMEEGDVYCVAPVTGQSFSDTPLYYAVGVNCCDQRSNFQCSQAQPSAGKKLSAIVLGKGEDEPFQMAIRMSSSVYNMKLGKQRIALKFFSDVDAYQGDLWHGAFISLICASVLHGFICVLTAFLLRNLLKDAPPRSSAF